MTGRMPPPTKSDLDLCCGGMPFWEDFRSKRIFVTGGTGFVGRWLLESIVEANDRLGLNVEVTILSRDPEAWRFNAPHLAPRVRAVRGDVRSFELDVISADWIVHAAGPTRRADLAVADADVYDQIVEGTRRVLALTERGSASRLLMISSGAVYGSMPENVACFDESGWPRSGVEGGGAYAEGKRAAEALCAQAKSVDCIIARCFSFVGAFLPLQDRFAIGNFLWDALQQRPIKVLGGGEDIRSYLYAPEMASWLWALMARGSGGAAYNVGSSEPITVRALAELVAVTAANASKVEIGAAVPGRVTRYVPNVTRFYQEFQMRPHIPLADAIQRTFHWFASVE